MGTNKWDRYFQQHETYKPKNFSWSNSDLEYSYRWYKNWFWFLDTFILKPEVKGKKVLEVGCGIGGVCKILKERGGLVTGSDITSKILEIAQELQPDIKFIKLDLRKKPNSKTKYELVFGFEVVEHIFDPSLVIKNINTLLSDTGIFIGSTPYPFPKNLLDPTHRSVLYPEEWRSLFKHSGFQTVDIKPLSFPPYLWRIHSSFNIPIPWYIRNSKFVSTSLIVAYKKKQNRFSKSIK